MVPDKFKISGFEFNVKTSNTTLLLDLEGLFLLLKNSQE